MNDDSFYTKIQQRLAGQLVGQVFEECAVALLREVYGGLVPIRGGSDAGMDGAIADGKGRPWPLVCTTSQHGTTNLHKNLQSYMEKGGLRRQAVFATSRVLTKRRRDNLHKAAAKHGFTLIQIHDGADFADRLWRNSKWCKKLLRLTGDPYPLSVVPRSTRPLLNTAIVGREKDVAWLSEPVGDRLLVGQPGSGKTFLLRHLTREGRALFVNSRDRGEIAAGIREQEPSVLIVDDAAPSDSVIVDLLQLREEGGAEFTIIASCWPQQQDQLEEMLGVTKNSVRTLALLAQEEIAQVVEGTGLKLRVPLMNELVAQAEGRPGLATTLAHVLLQGGWEEVVSGKRLRQSLLGRLADEVIPVLGTFALGGTRGVMKQGVERTDLGPDDQLLGIRFPAVSMHAPGTQHLVGQFDHIRSA